MNANVSFSVTPQQFPAGTAGGAYHAQIFLADGTTPVAGVGAQVASPGVPVSFANLSAGDYVATVKRWNAAGSLVLASSSQPFTLSAPATVSIDVPTGVTVAAA
jgi:hypothetical protein